MKLTTGLNALGDAKDGREDVADRQLVGGEGR